MIAAIALAPPETAIVITATALPAPKAERAYGVERLDRRRIAAAPSRALDQILKDVPGLQLFRRSDSRSANPTSQGVTLRALGGNASSRALLILDGVPQATGAGSRPRAVGRCSRSMAGSACVRRPISAGACRP